MTARRKVLVSSAALVVLVSGTVWTSREMPLPTLYSPVDAPAHEVAVVLGAKPGPLLTQRMDAACALFENGRVGKLVLSGLPEEMPYMRERANACGARETDGSLAVDDGATRTLENLRRARDRFGVTRAIIVTQRFHMDRALYLAAALGIDATGVVATGHPRSLLGRMRERAARARARLDVALLP